MKDFFKISALVLGFTLSTATQIHGQDLPMVCAGSVSTYWVKGLNGHSNFTWTITSPSGTVMPYTPVNSGADTISIDWNTNEPGIYSFSVVETTEFGCTGVPYEGQYIILNTNDLSIPFSGVPTSFSSCAGIEVTLDPGDFHNYLWTINSSTNRTYVTTEAGTYEVRLVDENQSCTFNDIEAKFNPLPTVWLGNDTILFGSQTLELNVEDPLFTAYDWSTGATTPSIWVDGLSGDQNISVTVTDINGCTNSDEIKISAANYKDLVIPAAFTPNGDWYNDQWFFPKHVKGTNLDVTPYIDNVNVKVFNRWGKLVWATTKKGDYWDGTDLNGRSLPMDSYHYIIVFKIGAHEYTYKGSVTIIR